MRFELELIIGSFVYLSGLPLTGGLQEGEKKGFPVRHQPSFPFTITFMYAIEAR